MYSFFFFLSKKENRLFLVVVVVVVEKERIEKDEKKKKRGKKRENNLKSFSHNEGRTMILFPQASFLSFFEVPILPLCQLSLSPKAKLHSRLSSFKKRGVTNQR